MKQISIFIENKSNRLTEATEVIAKAGINITAASLADTADFGVLRIVVNDTEKAVRTLKERYYTISVNDVVGIEVEDRPGGLAEILKVLSDHSLNVEYMYAFVEPTRGSAAMILRLEEPERGTRVLKDAGVSFVPES